MRPFPELQEKALDYAAKHLFILSDSMTFSAPATCSDFLEVVKFLAYAINVSQRLPGNDQLQKLKSTWLQRANQASADCDSLEDSGLGEMHFSDQLLRAVNFVDVMTEPELKLPQGTEDYVKTLWQGLSSGRLPDRNYIIPRAHNFEKGTPIPGAIAYEEGARSSTFIELAYLATHIPLMVTGYGRHQLFVEDSKWLYKFFASQLLRRHGGVLNGLVL
jgi:hypothetical protein